MSKAVAFGSVTVTDLSDLAELSVLPMSNLPLTVIYDPNYSTFTPNWGTNNLVLTPSVYYGGTSIALNDQALTITWQRQEGAGAKTSPVSGETVTGGVLTVAANKFTSSSTSISYFVTAAYTEPVTGQTLRSVGQITYTLIKNGSWAENCTIMGDTVFKYDTDQHIVGASSITLTGAVNNVDISAWKYLNSSGNYVTYPNSGVTETLTVNASDSTFVGDKCTIKLETSDPEVFDVHVIVKLRDGAAGSNTVSAVLSNDDQMIPYAGSQGDFSAAVSQISIYEGGQNVTETWSISQSYTNVTATASRSSGTHGSNNDTTTITGFIGDVMSGNVTFTCSKSGYNDIIKNFSVVKVSSGQDGVSPTIYGLTADNIVLVQSEQGAYDPSSVTFSSYQQTGQSKTAYSGRFQIFENITLAEYDAASPKPTAKYTSSSNESYKTYVPSTDSVSSILCILYQAGSTTTRLDSQLVVVASDGATGATGAKGDTGEPAVNVIWGNHSDVLTCTHDNKIIAAQTIRIPFYGFKGTTRVNCTVTSVNLLGITPTKQDATTSQDGYIQWILPQGTAVNAASGTLSITFNIEGQSVVEQYSWSRNPQAADGRDGENVITLSITAENGIQEIDQNHQTVTLNGSLMDGSTDATSLATYQWMKLVSGNYANVQNGTASSYTVPALDVDGYASYMLEATYPAGGTKKYTAFFAVFDRTDPIQVSVHSSMGHQIINGEGVGALYVKVTQGSSGEVDKIKSERFLESNPSTAKSGDYYYKLDSTNKAVTLMKYTSSWAVAPSTDDPTGQYSWTWRNNDGEIITSMNGYTLPTTGKVIYLDGSMIDKKIIADVEVQI